MRSTPWRDECEERADQDVAVILVSSHGEMIQGKFYLIPYGFDARSQTQEQLSAVSASEFAEKVRHRRPWQGPALARRLSFRGDRRWRLGDRPGRKVLQDAMDLENVTVLTSSKKNELSEELPEWRHGALAEAFLDALKGAADAEGHRPALGPDRRDGERGSIPDQGPTAPRHACQFQRRPVHGESLLTVGGGRRFV